MHPLRSAKEGHMTDDIQALRDDIAYLKALADDGKNGGGKGGWILVAAGGFYGLASLTQWAALQHLVPALASTVAWAVALIGFMSALFLTLSRQRADGVKRKAPGLAWSGVGFALFTLFIAI